MDNLDQKIQQFDQMTNAVSKLKEKSNKLSSYFFNQRLPQLFAEEIQPKMMSIFIRPNLLDDKSVLEKMNAEYRKATRVSLGMGKVYSGRDVPVEAEIFMQLDTHAGGYFAFTNSLTAGIVSVHHINSMLASADPLCRLFANPDLYLEQMAENFMKYFMTKHISKDLDEAETSLVRLSYFESIMGPEKPLFSQLLKTWESAEKLNRAVSA